MKDKIKRIKKMMRRRKVNTLILLSEPNIRYLTDQIDLCSILVLPLEGKPIVLTTPFEKDRSELSGLEVFSFSRILNADIKTKNIYDALKKIFKKKGFKIKKVGCDISNASITQVERIKKKLGHKIIDVTDDILKIRAVKNSEEIKRIRLASSVTKKAMALAKQLLGQGLTEIELADSIESLMRRKAGYFSFKTIVASGSNSSMPHHLPTNKTIKKGNVVLIDIGALYKGYCSDMSRTFCLEPNKEVEEIHKIVLKAQKDTISKLKIGFRANQVDKTARNIIKKSGYELIHGTGHGVGVEIHELPSFKSKSRQKLREGMIFTVEPGIYIKNKFGIRIEDTILLTKKGPQILTKYPRGLL